METLKDFLIHRGYSKIKLKFTKTNHFEIKAYINGVKGQFILDTGASSSCVGFEAIERFNLKVKDSEIKFRKWLPGIDTISKINIPKNGFDKLSLNYQSLLPEYNLRNNWKNVDKKLFTRPLQLKFFKDIENPYYNQLFYTPVFGYNYYDGIILGMAFSNQTFINKSINFKVTPSYSTKSNSFSGSYAIKYEHLPENKNVNKLIFGIAGNHYDYAPDLSYSKIVPYGLLEFKKKNYRDISSNAISAAYTIVDKTPSPTETQNLETLKYNVLSIGYGYAKPNILEDIRFSTGFQVSDKFSKVSVDAQYRLLTNTNTQFDFRFFAGAFLYSKIPLGEKNFDFALDRPTDYLFDYNYLGQFESSGIFSQQLIIAEGGFKSKLDTAFANQWLTSLNASASIWKFFQAYGDIGLLKNKGDNPLFVYDAGIRLNLITDYFEVYFPVYSNLGWEIAQPQYRDRIRFIFTADPQALLGLFRREWF